MPTLGLIMIARNEEHNLGRSLGPVAHLFDQVVLLDTGSTDNTKAHARALGAQVHDFIWQDDFAQARNRSIELSGSDWLMWLDGDNSVAEPAGIDQLRAMLPEEPAIIWGLERVVGSGELLWQKRVFPRRPEVRFTGLVHEQLSHPAHWPSLPSSLVIDHWGYEDPVRVKEKGVYYLGLLHKTLQAEPGDFYARFQAARCHFNLRQFNEAYEELCLASQAGGHENPELTSRIEIMRSQVLERLMRADEALELLLGLTRQQPANALAFFSAGRLAYTMEKYSLAARLLRQSLALDLGAPMLDLNPRQTRFTASYLLGLALNRLGRETAAAASLEQALLIFPDHRGARLDLAELKWRQNYKNDALAHLQMVLQHYPEDARSKRLARKWKENA